MLRRLLPLIVCLLAGALLVDDAAAQRRSSRGGGGSGGSSVRSSGGSSRGSVSRASQSVSRSRSVSRPSSSRSSISRPSTSRSSSSRSTATPTYSSRSTSSRSYEASRDRTSPRTVIRSRPTTSRDTSRSLERADVSADRWRASETVERSTPTTPSTRDLSRPVDSGSRIIDLTDAGVSPRVRFPRAADRFRAEQEARPAPGSRRSLSQELRSRVGSEDLTRLKRNASRSTPTYRSGTVDRQDILQRYRGSERAASEVDPRVLRRAAAETDGLSAARRADTAREAKQALDAERTAAAREAKQALDAERAVRARADQQAQRQERIQKAREKYLDSIGAGDGGGGDSGSGSGGGDGDEHHDDDDDHHHHHDHHHHWNLYWTYWGHYWGHGYHGFHYYCPAWAWTYWWHSYWYFGGYWHHHHYPSYYWYGPFYPVRASVVVVQDRGPDVVYFEQEPEVIYVEEAPAGEAAEQPEGPALPTVVPEAPEGEGLNRAADYYLTLGDRAFRDGRYGDAVHFYAKAVEYGPEEGILYLILSDALFATGDYHYAAYALRKAVELDPALFTSIVDKHAFYSDPAEFDRQLEVLEGYLEDHFLDDDARLVLAANYLFGGRPAEAEALLQSAFSLEVKESPAGQEILEAARAVQQGGSESASGGTPND